MKGAYILVAYNNRDSKIRVGSLGKLVLPKGYYCYIGSALGKATNLENRTGRHKRIAREKKGKLKWHIDYLLASPNVSILKIFSIETDKRIECWISKLLENMAEKTIHRFGSSDCRCKGHLHYFRKG
jgi:Uri superfamily endonuclease